MTLATRHWDRLGNGGLTFTELGFGTAPLGNLYRAISDEEADAILDRAWAAGVRYFDTAPLYGLGLSETRLNRFLRGKPRDSYVLTSKVGRQLRVCGHGEERDGIGKWFEVPNRREVYDYGYDGVLRSVEASLERLGLDRIDVLLAHDLDIANHKSPEALAARMDELMNGGYRALLRLRDEGVIKGFGAGVNEWESCKTLTDRGDFDIFLLAGRYTLLEHEALTTWMPEAEARGIGVIMGGPYNSGILATGPRPGAFWFYEPAPQEILDRAGAIQAVTNRHGVRLVDAAFQFALRHPAVVSVIPGGQGVAEMDSNVTAARAEIPDAMWAELKTEGLIHRDAPVERGV
ncbi:MAG: pyridoxal 4-dehydrogenase [Cereibacter sphaeroides]|uniref:Pyridoxal 4-dehydrogenase n=1 Tax=Cereibacter sphaeroides TaxID=1063 RepID=A0A2W5TU66_CERSP|nr:MAG: pyridoxal 4-dehydrogenase [Cereibacter sphaeroides]